MDFMVRYITGRNLMILIIMLMTTAFAYRFRDYPIQKYVDWRYPPLGPRGDEGQVILDELEKQAAARLERKYQRISRLLDASRAEGFQVADIDWKAREARALNVPGRRAEAEELLYRIELDIPRKKVQYIPMDESAVKVEEESAPKPKRRRRRRRRSR